MINGPSCKENWPPGQLTISLKLVIARDTSLQLPQPEYVLEAIHHVVEQVVERNGRTLAESYQEHKQV